MILSSHLQYRDNIWDQSHRTLDQLLLSHIFWTLFHLKTCCWFCDEADTYVTIIGGHDASLGGGRTGDRWALTLVSEVAPGLTLTIVPCTLITLHLTCNTGHQQTRSETLKHFNKFLEKRTYTRKKKFRRRCESILDQWCTKDLQTNIKQYLGQFARLIISIGTKINSCKGQTVCLILMWKWKWMWQIIEYWLVSNEIQSSRKSLVILNIF